MKKNTANKLVKYKHIKWDIVKTICGIAVFMLFITTCKIGLGETVDALPPELTISYPSPLEKIIIRGEFVMKGSVTDDTLVSAVHISFIGKENGIQYRYGPYIATVDAANKSWSFTLNTPNTTSGKPVYPMKDAVYTVTVTAYDDAKRATSVSTDYEIDNTAPVVVMQQPGSADIAIPESYGALLKLSGQAVDTNIDKLTFTAFDENKNKIESVTIPLGSQAIKAEIGEFENASLNDGFYDKIYGNDDGVGSKQLFYTVQASDKAREYKGQSSDTGNLSTEYYLFNDTSTIVFADDLYSMNTGQYYTNSDATIDTVKKAEYEAILNQLTSLAIGVNVLEGSSQSFALSGSESAAVNRLGVFTLDPTKDPTYSLVGATPVAGGNFADLLNNKMNTASSLVVELIPNKDGDVLDLDKVTIRALQLKINAIDGAINVANGEYVDDGVDAAYRLYPAPVGIEVEIAVSGGRYTLTMKQKGVREDVKSVPDPKNPSKDGSSEDLPVGAYIIEVTGEDKIGNVYNISNHYGFQIEGNGQSPELIVTEINGENKSSSTVYVKEDADTVFAGTTNSYAGDKVITLAYKFNMDGEPVNVDVLSYPDWKFTIPSTAFGTPAPTKSDSYPLYITATDSVKKFTTQEFTLYYDVEDPDFDADDLKYEAVSAPLTTASGGVDAPNNKEVTVHGTSNDDDQIAFYSYNVTVDAEVKIPTADAENTTVDTDGNRWTADVATTGKFNFSFNTTGTVGSDGLIPADTKVNVRVKDRAGNEKPASLTLDSTPPTLSDAQVTTTVSWTNPDDKTKWYNSSVLEVKVLATDGGSGVTSIEWTTTPDISDTWKKISVSIDADGTGTGTGDISVKTTGTHTISFRATDAAHNVSDITEITANVDLAAPEQLTLHSIRGVVTNDLLQYSNGKDSIEVVVKNLVDAGTGIASIRLFSIDGEPFPDSIPVDPFPDSIPVDPKKDDTTASITITAEEIKSASSGGVIFEVKDKVGNSTITPLFTLNVDTESPTLTLSYTADFGTEKVTVKGTAVDNTPKVAFYSYKVTGDASEIVTDTSIPDNAKGGFSFSFTRPTLDSSTGCIPATEVSVTVKDRVGNVSEPAIINLDVTPPTIVLDHDVSTDPTDGKIVTVTGTASDAETIPDTTELAKGTYEVFLKTMINGTAHSRVGNEPKNLINLSVVPSSTLENFKFSFNLKDIVTTSLPDGTTEEVEVDVILYDDLGNKTTRTEIVDTHKPVLTAPTITTEVVDGTDWYKDAVLEVSVSATDAGTGVQSIEWTTTPDNSATWKKISVSIDADGTGKGTGDISVKTTGTHTFSFRATDNAQNVSDITEIEAKVDLAVPQNPTFDSATPKNGIESSAATQYSNASKDITVTLSNVYDNLVGVNETGSGIASIQLYKIGSTNFITPSTDVAPSSPVLGRTTGNVDITITTAELQDALDKNSSGGVVFRITDKVGLTTDFTAFSLILDKDPPSLNSLDYEVEGSGNTIKVTGIASDSSGIEPVYVVSVTDVKKDDITMILIGDDGKLSFTFPAPTATGSTGDSVIPATTVTVKIKDKAGNEFEDEKVLDNTVPVIAFDTPSHTVDANKKVTVTGTASDAGIGLATDGSYVVKVGGSLVTGNLGQTFTYTGNNFTFDVSDINALGSSSGAKVEIIVTVADKLGNKKTESLFVDTTAPVFGSGDESPTVTTLGVGVGDEEKKWYKSTSLNVKITVEDEVSEGALIPTDVKSVEWATGTENPTDANSWKHLLQDGKTTKWTGTVTVEEGKGQTIYFRATDGSYNVGYAEISEVNVDISAPMGLELGSNDTNEHEEAIITPNRLVNGKLPISVIVNGATDGESGVGSGVATVRLLQIGNTTFEDGGTVDDSGSPKDSETHSVAVPIVVGGDTTITIATAQLIRNSKGNEGSVRFRLTDNAGNYTDSALFSLTVDNTPPDGFFINEPNGDGEEVYGSATIRGKASDNNLLKTVILEAQELVATGKEGTFQWFEVGTTTGIWDWNTVLDTTAADVVKYISRTSSTKGNIILRATATDEAGNTASSKGVQIRTIRVNQDLDRPVIALTNVKLTDDKSTVMSKDNPMLHSAKNITGVVSDTDGIKKFEIRITEKGVSPSTDGWVEVKPSASGSWTHSLGDDGIKTIDFRVTDNTNPTVDSVDITDVDVYTSIALVGASLPSGEVLQRSPKLTDDTTFFGYIGSSEQGSSVYLEVDNNDPTIDSIQIKTGTSSNYEAHTENMALGGDKSKFSLKISAKDANEIVSLVIFDEKESTIIEIPGIDGSGILGGEITGISGGVMFTTDDIDTKTVIGGFKDGSKTLTVEVTDKAKNKVTRALRFVIDNSPPTIEVLTPKKDTRETGAFEIGVAIDAGGSSAAELAKLEYYIPNRKDNGWIQPVNKTGNSEESSTTQFWKLIVEPENNTLPTLTWKYQFGQDGATDLSTYATSEYGEEVLDENGKGINEWKLPIVFRLTDSVGNVNITKITDYMLQIDPDGDTPTVLITSPEHDVTMGGSITILGSASDNEGLAAVYIQIDPDVSSNVSDFSDADFNKLSQMKNDTVFIYPQGFINDKNPQDDIVVGTLNKFAAVHTTEGDVVSDAWWGIKVDSTTNWNLLVNKFDELGTGFYYRARAVDNNGKLSGWSDPRKLKLDVGVPRISVVELVKYKNPSSSVEKSTRIAEQIVSSGIAIQDGWYLTAVIEDTGGIDTIEVKNSGGDVLVSLATDFSLFTGTSQEYTMNIPISEIIKTTGLFKFSITVRDNGQSPATTTWSSSINLDNAKPDFDLLKHASSLISNTNTVEASNTTFEFGSNVKEESGGSGFSRIAFWFERSISGSPSRIYNIMEKATAGVLNTTDLVTNKENEKVSWVAGGLPRLHLATVYRGANDTLQHDKIINNKNVRKDGLVKIGGVDRSITGVDYDTGTITFTPGVGRDYTEADIAYVMLANNTRREIRISATEIANDDKDGMVEYVNIEKGDWFAQIESKNIPDGPITIHAVAFDNAGNSNAISVDTMVTNNKPRIAKIWLGTDLNGSKGVTADERIEYSTLENNKAVTTAIIDVLTYNALTGDKPFTAKGLTHVTPEIVGGNGDLYYSFTTKSLDKPEVVDKTQGVVLFSGDSEGTRIRGKEDEAVDENGYPKLAKTSPIELKLKNTTLNGKTADYLLGLADTIGDAGREFVFTIWDSTEETIVGSTSQKATLTVKMHVDVVDDVAPKSVISPFYWTDKDKNSLYENSLANGHIELEGHLSTDIFDGSSSLMDTDPKVSGKISLRGTAYDDKILSEIWASIDGFTFSKHLGSGTGSTATEGMVKLATYTPAESGKPAEWTVAGTTIDTDGWQFKVEPISFGQGGHSVTWQLDWDSQKLTGVAGLDKTVTIISKDTTNNYTEASPNGTINDDETVYNKPKYRMDIVPYIKTVTTKLSNIDGTNPTTNSRTALGKYPVYVGETITMTGFNMGKTGVQTSIAGKKEIGGTQDHSINVPTPTLNSLTITIDARLVSSDVKIIVGTVESLNNLNDNTVEYNMLPNDANNNLLVDDVAFDVWQYDTVAEKRDAKILYPELRINPNTGLVGFAFANGNYHFNMPGKDSGGGNFVSQRPIERGYGPFFESALAFDPQGNVYGLSTNEDAGPLYSSFSTFYFDRVGSGAMNARANYNGGTYKRRLMSTTSNTKVGGVANLLDTEIRRVVSPSMAATLATNTGRTDANRSNVYLAYYDEISKEIRYQWGSIGGTLEHNANLEEGLTIRLDNHGFTNGQQVTIAGRGSEMNYNPEHNRLFYVIEAASNTFKVALSSDGTSIKPNADWTDNDIRVSAVGGQIADITGGQSGSDNPGTGAYRSIEDLRSENYSVIADSEASGSHVSLDARSGVPGVVNSTNDLVVITWFNNKTRELWYAYNTNPQSGNSATNSFTKKKIDSAAGWYNAVKIDADGGIHIAYYDISGADLKYVKLDRYDSSPTPITIDSYQLAGTQIRLDVAQSIVNGTLQQVPYISYYAPSTQTAKLAYQVNFSGSSMSGADDYKFTGNWEVSNVPTPNSPRDDAINIGVHKEYNTGLLKAIPIVGSSPNISPTGSNNTTTSNVGGNGTKNPVVAYVIQSTSDLEMTQKK